MSIRFLMTLICAVIVSSGPLAAQDHTHHHAQQEAIKRLQGQPIANPTCGSGGCPMAQGECACCKSGQCPMMNDPHAGHGAHGMTPISGNPAQDELNAAMARMHADMNVPLTGDPDADFMRGMIPHHQGAIDMASIVLKYGDDPETRALARTIIRAQKGEIALMRRWLDRRQLPEKDAIDLNR